VATINLDYFAGLFDGEGSVSINLRNDGFQTVAGRIAIAMTHPIVMELPTAFGCGSTHAQNRKTKSGLQVYIWSVQDRKELLRFLPTLIPLLRVKKQQASLLFDFCSHLSITDSGKGKKLSPEEKAYRKTFVQRCKELNGSL
jgi:hypothetical protein